MTARCIACNTIAVRCARGRRVASRCLPDYWQDSRTSYAGRDCFPWRADLFSAGDGGGRAEQRGGVGGGGGRWNSRHAATGDGIFCTDRSDRWGATAGGGVQRSEQSFAVPGAIGEL